MECTLQVMFIILLSSDPAVTDYELSFLENSPLTAAKTRQNLLPLSYNIGGQHIPVVSRIYDYDFTYLEVSTKVSCK